MSGDQTDEFEEAARHLREVMGQLYSDDPAQAQARLAEMEAHEALGVYRAEPSDTAQEARSRPKSIGLWGAPSSGKTTFLAALSVAVNRASRDLNIFGVDDDSTEFMVDSNRMLTNKHRFPEGTQSVSSYSWTMNMTTMVQPDKSSRFARSGAPVAVPTQFNLDLRDAPGRSFGSDPGGALGSVLDLGDGTPEAPADPEEMMDYLTGTRGLLLLIDPIRERRHGDAHEYLQGTLLRSAHRRMALMPPGSKLPHHVAVCITKFDDPEVYRFARLNGYRTYDDDDPYMFPQVRSDDAESFLREICNSDISDADLICDSLQKFFHPERIRYFVTSAVGFYLKGERFRESDSQNVVQQDGQVRIRGQIHPINVLEPILWLGQNVGA